MTTFAKMIMGLVEEYILNLEGAVGTHLSFHIFDWGQTGQHLGFALQRLFTVLTLHRGRH